MATEVKTSGSMARKQLNRVQTRLQRQRQKREDQICAEMNRPRIDPLRFRTHRGERQEREHLKAAPIDWARRKEHSGIEDPSIGLANRICEAMLHLDATTVETRTAIHAPAASDIR
jgi:hypothetical protein